MTKILIVEDDVFLVKVYKLKLEQAGFKVHYLQDGSNIPNEAIEFDPDLIILDILVPIKDGYEILAELKSNPVTAKIPVLILSALQMDNEIEKGKKLGATQYLPKTSVTFDQVLSAVHQLTS